ncbi:hypothetical protein [Actinoplanes sp. URMC 104]|uniref:hypothetical protein n=1 Tax=Actinoplanes sp. URMC 104 TaxID=3423409 RepID=UPI003F199748
MSSSILRRRMPATAAASLAAITALTLASPAAPAQAARRKCTWSGVKCTWYLDQRETRDFAGGIGVVGIGSGFIPGIGKITAATIGADIILINRMLDHNACVTITIDAIRRTPQQFFARCP